MTLTNAIIIHIFIIYIQTNGDAIKEVNAFKENNF